MQILTYILVILNAAIIVLFIYNIVMIQRSIQKVGAVVNSPDVKKIENSATNVANALSGINFPQLSQNLSTASASLSNISSKVNSICSQTIAGTHLC